MTTINAITAVFEYFRTYSKAPFLFRASFPPDEIIFNHDLDIYLVRLEGIPDLHVFDTHTHFQNAIPIRSKKS